MVLGATVTLPLSPRGIQQPASNVSSDAMPCYPSSSSSNPTSRKDNVTKAFRAAEDEIPKESHKTKPSQLISGSTSSIKPKCLGSVVITNYSIRFFASI